MAIEDYYTTLSLLESAGVKNASGVVVKTWSVASTFEGCVNQATSREIDANKKLDIDVDSKLYCAVSVDISHVNRVKDGSITYRVVSTPKNTVKRGHHYKIFLKRTSDEDV